MGGLSGDESKGTSNETNEQKSIEIVPCIVKFRPCEKWRGEYGFDWVREKDGYEETIKCDHAEKNFYFDYSNKAQEDFLKERMGEKNYKHTMHKEERRLRKMHAQDNTPFDQGELDDYMYQLYDRYKNDAWAYSDPNQYEYDDSAMKKSEDLSPIDYFYGHTYIKKVVYRIDREQYGDVFYLDEMEYKDMDNGSDEAEDDSASNKAIPLEWFVAIGNSDHPIKQSLINENGEFKIPLYYERDAFLMSPDSSKIVEYKKEGCFFHFDYYAKNGDDFLMACIKKTDGHGSPGDEVWFKYKNNNLLSYGVGGAPSHDDPDPVVDVSDEERIRQVDPNGFHNYLIANEKQVVKNEKMSIVDLLDDNSIDNVKVEINHPMRRSSYGIAKDEKELDDGRVRYSWKGHRIYKWKEWYENSFHLFPYDYDRSTDKLTRLSLKGEEEPYKYCVPILSFGIGDKRKRFEFRTSHDAPRKTKENRNEYNIQLFVKGDCDKIRLKSTHENILETRPKGDLVPQDGKVQVKVKFKGEKACKNAFITAYSVQKDENDKEIEIPVGKLQVNVHDPRVLKAVFVKVVTGERKVIDGKKVFVADPFDQNLVNCLDDQVDAMTNALGQVGIRSLIRKNCTIHVARSLLTDYKNNDGKFKDDDESRLPLAKQFFKVFRNKYGKDLELCYYYPIFFVDGESDDETSAYENEYSMPEMRMVYPKGKPMIVSFKDIAYDRSDAYCMAHELFHGLTLMHSFQRIGWSNPNDFCFPIEGTSNIMDYYNLVYSLNKEQWSIIREAVKNNNRLVKNELTRLEKEKNGEK